MPHRPQLVDRPIVHLRGALSDVLNGPHTNLGTQVPLHKRTRRVSVPWKVLLAKHDRVDAFRNRRTAKARHSRSADPRLGARYTSTPSARNMSAADQRQKSGSSWSKMGRSPAAGAAARAMGENSTIPLDTPGRSPERSHPPPGEVLRPPSPSAKRHGSQWVQPTRLPAPSPWLRARDRCWVVPFGQSTAAAERAGDATIRR